MGAEHAAEFLVTTLGDLAAALSAAALEICDDKRKAYLLASLALEEILKGTSRREAGIAEFSDEPSSGRIVFH